jgi:hypothetical protein
MIKYTTQFLLKLEDMIAESDYTLRYEKGNFKAGFCVLKDQKIMIINKFFTTEGKINALLEILKGVTLTPVKFTEKSIKLYDELVQNQHIQPAQPQSAEEQPAAEQPVAEESPAEQATAEQPSAEQPSSEGPAAEATPADQPSPEQPSTAA